MVVATKGGCPVEGARHVPRMSDAELEGDLQNSLRNLRADAVDIYYLHRDDPSRSVEEIIGFLERKVKAGLIRYYGLSNWRLSRLEAALRCAGSGGHLVVSEVLWSLARPNLAAIEDPSIAAMDEPMRAFHQRTGLAAAAYTAQARGFFTKLSDGNPARAQDWVLATYYTPENMGRLERAKALAARLGCSLEAVVLAYLTSQSFPVLPIISSRNHQQLALSLGAANLVLTTDQLDYLIGLDSCEPGGAL